MIAYTATGADSADKSSPTATTGGVINRYVHIVPRDLVARSFSDSASEYARKMQRILEELKRIEITTACQHIMHDGYKLRSDPPKIKAPCVRVIPTHRVLRCNRRGIGLRIRSI